jgi:outer membrane murein-binding lipoprotein Lpp
VTKPLPSSLTARLASAPLLAAVATVATLGGCASASKDIAATAVPTLAYQAYDCEQIGAELQRVGTRAHQLAGRLDEAARNDKAIAGVGALVFWPALFALGGNKEQEAEYARLKGEHDALLQTAVLKKCPGATSAGMAATAAAR